MLTVEVAVRDPKYGEELALNVYELPDEVIARGPLAEAEFRQLVQVRPLVKSQARGEVVVEVTSWLPFPASRPERVVVPLTPITPVDELYEIIDPPEREVEAILLLNIVQSVEER